MNGHDITTPRTSQTTMPVIRAARVRIAPQSRYTNESSAP